MQLSTLAFRLDLSSNTKNVAIAFLNARLADAIDLALLTKQGHWNLKGSEFIAIHEMIDQFRANLDDHVDTMAERGRPAWGHRARHDAGRGKGNNARSLSDGYLKDRRSTERADRALRQSRQSNPQVDRSGR